MREVTSTPPAQGGLMPLLAGLTVEPYLHGAGLAGGALTAAKEGIKGARYAAQKMGQRSDIARNQTMARMLVAEGPERNQLLSLLRGRQGARLSDVLQLIPLPH